MKSGLDAMPLFLLDNLLNQLWIFMIVLFPLFYICLKRHLFASLEEYVVSFIFDLSLEKKDLDMIYETRKIFYCYNKGMNGQIFKKTIHFLNNWIDCSKKMHTLKIHSSYKNQTRRLWYGIQFIWSFWK